jgi:hypothetical protein
MNERPRTFIATIHDSIVTTRDQADSIKDVMREEFSRIGLSPTIRVEDLRPPESSYICREVAS